MKQVVITGIGAVTPLGPSFRESWKAALSSCSGIRPLHLAGHASSRWKVAGNAKDFSPDRFLTLREQKRLDPFAWYAVAAAVMAAGDAGLIGLRANDTWTGAKEGTRPEPEEYLKSGGVIIGSSRGGISTIEKALISMLSAEGSTRKVRGPSPYLMPSSTISMAASYAAQKLGVQGYCLGISNACTSGANSIGEAYRLLKSGFQGPLLAGGTDAPLCRTCIEGYGAAGALSGAPDQTASRPFHRDRDGFVLSEGACVLVLEEYNAALKRGARIYAEVSGYGNSADAFHQTRPLPEGEARAILGALSDAGLGPGETDFISCHGTSTPAGDLSEGRAIHRVFGGRAASLPVSAMKSLTGHMLAASGAFETACAAMALSQGILFPTINLSEQDEAIELSVVREPRPAAIKTVLVNSFGFGGVNAALVLKKSG